jgi:ABC-type dipeptide/oligopeptide/nickel transport system ATPase subunit
MSLSQELHREIENGRTGKSGIIPLLYERVQEYIDIAKNTMYTIGGESGSGKSTVAQDMFMINPLQWYLKNKNPDIKLSIIYFGMERKMYQYSARWISRLIFQEQGITIPPKRILGRKKEYMMDEKEYALVQHYYSVLDEWEKDDLLIAHEGSKNPSGISIYLEKFARKHGTIIEKDKDDKTMENILETKRYVPNHPNHIVLVITDHIGILAPERKDTNSTQKGQIDKFSRTMREARDLYGFSPVIIQQLNRNLSDVSRQKLGELAPKLSDFADSSQTQQDSDVIIALFDPFRHAIGAELGKDNGYELKKLKDEKYRTFYRSLHILKNSFDSSGMQFPMAIQPEYGIFKTLPRKDKITEDIYGNVTTGNFFLE